MRELLNKGMWNGNMPSMMAIYRFASTHGLHRNPVKPQESVRSFEYANFGDMWGADFLHGPMVRTEIKDKNAYLHAIIDDVTRYIVGARFYLAEDTRALISDLMLAVRHFGIPKRLYTDYLSRNIIGIMCPSVICCLNQNILVKEG